MEVCGHGPDPRNMNRKVLWMCMAVGSTIGGYLPTLVGYSSLGAVSLLCSAVGGIAGVFAALRIDASL
jgi:hypothetical protein